MTRRGSSTSLPGGIELSEAVKVVEDGTWYIFKGGGALSQYESYSKRISSA